MTKKKDSKDLLIEALQETVKSQSDLIKSLMEQLAAAPFVPYSPPVQPWMPPYNPWTQPQIWCAVSRQA